MITLEFLQGARRGETLEVDGAEITVGRSPRCQVELPEPAFPPLLLRIVREGDHYLALGAASPVALRLRRGADELPLGEGNRIALRDGDQLLFDDPPLVVLACHPSESEAALPGRIEAERAFTDFARVAREVVSRSDDTARKLLEITQRLARRGLDLAAVFEGVGEAVLELVPRATHVAIALADPQGGRFNTVFSRGRAGAGAGAEGPSRASRAVVRSVQKQRYAVLFNDRELQSESIMGAQIQSTMGVPLWEGEAIRGVLQVDNRSASGLFFQSDLDVLVTLAGQATLAIENARLHQRLQLAEEQLRGENRYLKNREERRRAVEIVGDSPAMEAIFRQIEKVKDTRATVCIEGETGTGKELFASAIHYQGSRRDKLFVAQNCAAVPENLLESELFGHKRGAFTGADSEKKGLFEIADGGTLFLDEIGEMSLSLQAKLLRVLQEGRIRPVGATVEKQVDVRIVCATNRALEREVERGTFRQDLYYRLKVFPIRLPTLRERREDIPGLIDHFLRKYTAEMKKPVAGVTPEAMDALAAYAWPGNIRELENEVQRLVIQADAEAFIIPEMLAPQIRKVEELLSRVGPPRTRGGTLKDRMEEVERWLLTEALREHGWNKTRTAETLGMTREGLHKKLSKYGM